MKNNPSVFVDVELSSLIEESPVFQLNSYIQSFLGQISEFEQNEKTLEKLRRKFVDDYPVNRIINMNKEEYVVGLKDTFCYRIETELKDLGNMKGSYATKFGLYYGKSGDDLVQKYRFTKKYGNDVDEAWDNIKRQIVMLLVAGNNRDFSAIKKSSIAPIFRGKILSTYYPQYYLPIFVDEHLDYFLLKLGVSFSISDDVLEKQNKLLEWKNNNVYFKELSNSLFCSFLYSSFGRPFDDEKDEKNEQSEYDKKYPQDYVTRVKITINDWKQMLEDDSVFFPSDIKFLKRIYIAENHATTCYDLATQDGVSPSTYIKPVVALARRVSNWAQLDPIIGEHGKQVWWRILFWGRYREDLHFEWKLQPKLAKAISIIYPELDSIEINDIEDQKLNHDISRASLQNGQEDFVFSGTPKPKQAPSFINGHKAYPRDRKIAANALAHAHYLCEIDKRHVTFIRRNSEKNYTEPHHLVPMSCSDDYLVSLDTEENIVSLCSNCHNQIHYGKDADKLLSILYEKRKDALKAAGIDISFGRLLEIYNYFENQESDTMTEKMGMQDVEA